MNKNLLTKIKNYLSNYDKKVRHRKIFAGLAVIVAFCTILALIKPAITLENTLICEREEHVHSENCYTDEFICEETAENLNNDSCYQLVLTCEKEEHTHDENCYQKAKSSSTEIEITPIEDNFEIATFEARSTTSVIANLTIYATNYYSSAYNNAILAYSNASGQTVANVLSTTMSYTYWTALVVENQNGNYVVNNIIGSGSPKNTLVVPQNGFIILVNDSTSIAAISQVIVGAIVTSNFDFTNQNYNPAGLGTLSFSMEVDAGEEKPTIDNSSKLHIVEGADTKDLIEVNLYNYGTAINSMYDQNKKYPGFQQNGGTKNISTFDEYSFNFGDNITAEISNIRNNITHSGDTLDINSTNTKENNSINRPISGVMNSTLINGYPALKDGSSLAYLFTQNASTSTTKKNTESINGLFQYNSTTGAYSYNSRENHAQFNASNNTFTLYQEIITSNFMMYPFGNFLPFNSIVTEATQASTIDRSYFEMIANSALYKANNGYGSSYSQLASSLTQFIELMDAEYGSNWDSGTAASAYFKYAANLNDQVISTSSLSNVYSIDYDEATDFFFGLEMKMNFMQPKDGKTGQTGEELMKFYFTGDDDVWVYIDGILFLDLSGIHRHVGGEIDFYNGVVNYYDLDIATGDVKETPTKTVTFREILESATGNANSLNEKGTFENYSTHTFNFYYMERGSGSGVMRMNFNMPLLKKNSISVTKELTVDDGSSLGNPDFKFQILKATGDIKTEIPFIGEGTIYDVYNESGIKERTGTVLANGIFTLKAGETAVFSEIDENAGQYYVRELLDKEWASQYKQVTVDGEVTLVNSYNDITIGTEKFSGIETAIKDASSGNTYFNFNNRIDTNKYGSLKILKVISGSGTTSLTRNFNFTVKIDGILLPVGTTYYVKNKETNEVVTKTVQLEGIITFSSQEEVEINNILVGSTYEVVEETLSDYTTSYDNNTGLISELNQEVTVTITNTEKSSNIEIPILKTIENPDGKKHDYTFKLIQVTDETGLTGIPGSTMTTTIEDVETSKEGSFTITYYEPDYNSGDKIYYKISEEVNNSDSNTKYDETLYIVEVTIQKETDFQAMITKIIKNGENVSNIEFKNQILTNLIVSKEVRENISNSAIFDFTIEGTYQGKDVNATYKGLLKSGQETIEKDIIFTNGRATIQLKHNEELTILGLPYGMDYKITETSTDGYVVLYQINPDNNEDIYEGNFVSGELSDNNHVKFINVGGYQLPETGSSQTLILLIIGTLLTIIPIIYTGYMFYIKEKKVS